MEALRSPSNVGRNSQTSCSPGQMLVLIGSDGGRVTVSRAIATEASYVLRDLLDGYDLPPSAGVVRSDTHVVVTASHSANQEMDVAAAGGASSSQQRQQFLDDLFLVQGEEDTCTASSEDDIGVRRNGNRAAGPLSAGDGSVQSGSVPTGAAATASAGAPDIMDMLFMDHTAMPSASPAPTVSSGAPDGLLEDLLASAQPPSGKPPVHPQSARKGAGADATQTPPPTRTSQAVKASSSSPPAAAASPSPSPQPPQPIELPFPYFTSDILRIVCAHMSYRFRISAFGSTEDGCFRVYPVKTREIPRPMVLPLVDYLDSQDRLLIQDWDELTTVLVVKCATLLNYEELLTLASAKLATILTERSVEGLRTLLGVDSDFTAAEEAELKKEHQDDGWR